MKITTVTYHTNRPTQGSRYVHEHVELTAALGPRDTPQGVLEQLKLQARQMLYPELVDLRARLAKAAPFVAAELADVTEAELAALYEEHAEAFSELLRGKVAPVAFMQGLR